jgi:hypothetical protein
MMTRQGSRKTAMAMTALLALAAFATAASAAETYRFANGINATVHGADEIAASLETGRDGSPVFVHPSLGSVALVDDGRTWYPFDAAVVEQALASMHSFSTALDVDVFILPAPPADVMSSYARPGAIVLAPGTGPVPAQTVAYITVHEMGHVLTSAFLDDQAGRWDAYLALRGLDSDAYAADSHHADRPREILAEDIRFLFGGALATASGTIENRDLVLPSRVDGLQDLLAGFFAGRRDAGALVASSAWPNPCNPLTTIAMELPGGAFAAEAELRIYDVRGALVRVLRGGSESGGRVAIQWRGDTESGTAAASGRYLYVMKAAGAMARGSVTLVR